MKSTLSKTLRLSFWIYVYLTLPTKHLAQSPQTLADITISFSQLSKTLTSFNLQWENSSPNSWMAMGLNTVGQMVAKFFFYNQFSLIYLFKKTLIKIKCKVGASVVICARDSTGQAFIKGHYFNSGYSTPSLLDANNTYHSLALSSVRE